MYAQNRNVTYLDDLPDLEDLEHPRQVMNRPQQDLSGGIPDKYKKFIRNPSQFAPESGMALYNQPPSQEFFTPPIQQQQQQQKQQQQHNGPLDMHSCLDVHAHVTQCPICSRFFRFDNTVYIIAIVVLTIICILLLKRVLNL